MLWETVRLALRSIARNLLRSFLTVLGVVIGVAAVIAMVTIGQGSSARVTADISSLGSNVIIVSPGAGRMGPPRDGDRAPSFRLADADALAALPVVVATAPVVSASQTAVAGNANIATSVTGTTTGYFTIANWTLARGRAFTPAEERGGASVCVIGESVRQTLFGNTDPTGEAIRLGNLSCAVIGLLAAKGTSSFGQDQDNTILMPARAVMRRLTGSQDVGSITVALSSGVTTARGIRDITALLRERRRIDIGEADDFSVTDLKEIASILTGISAVLTGLLASVAAVSLLVGGIGIMNIMLVSVTERTREIGIRMAIGAQAGQVLLQFLVEAVVLSVLGGMIGIALGLGLAALASGFMAIPFAPEPAVVALAFVFSALVGVVFGYFPARRAARLDPIEALRHQ